ncbi:helix-turn-helix domain-containing protein [Bifidobacterium sp. SMB2]|uniref:Helix-turn-helix domain-containing protein n=1 Tax=Bifidobacterium saimiriisciurei TaxID=2661627 RepID=A0ABX0C956_9BIFI|nr:MULTISPECIES: excisionase [Bifidobacterium]NEG95688.1 helix-turn-helix domain-containing protein [Bifidobacterium sp. SMB2]NEH11115.1 helix-turn-helix domain-containing protein [Bifidobacterium saimiriisciurei]
MPSVIPHIPINEKLTLTVSEAAGLSGIPVRVVRSAIRRNELRSCEAGEATIRVRRTDLDSWVAALPERRR